MPQLNCLAVAEAAHLGPGKKSGADSFFTCPRCHSESLLITAGNTWACKPCNWSGNAWKLASFVSRLAAIDKPGLEAWLKQHGLTDGSGDKQMQSSSITPPKTSPPVQPTDSNPTVIAAFKFPPSLEPKHVEILKTRAIPKEFALASGVRTAADNELRELNFHASLPIDERKHGLFGIVFPFRDLETGQECAWRLRPDKPFSLSNGDQAKYLSRIGDKVRAFYPHTTTAEHRNKPNVNVIITEGEFKALAIAENIVPITSRPTCVIGLQGVGGWHRDKITVMLPDGTKETRKEGAPHLIDDLLAWEWKKRVVYIVFDSDIATKKHAEEFRRNKRAGAWGAEYTLAQLLRAQGAEVRIVTIPPKIDGAKCGADDYIAERGAHEFLKLLYNNWTVERNVDEVLYQEKAAAIKFETSIDFVSSARDQTRFIIDQVIPAPGVAMIAGATGLGKSAIALNAAYGVATGGKFLGRFECGPAKALYIQTELNRTLLAERIRSVGTCDNLLIWTPGDSLPLNWWEPDGFNKRRETGHREIFLGIVDQVKSHGVSFVIFDPFSDFHSFPQSDPEGARHMMSLFRYLATVCRCGVLIVHHHKKIGRSDSRYEGVEDAFGSVFLGAKIDTGMSMYAYTRNDGTSRYKLKFSKQRCSAPLPDQEINRIAQNDFFRWEAEDWQDDAQTKIEDRNTAILEYLESRPEGVSSEQAIKDLKMARTTWFRALEGLKKGRKIRKVGNLYSLSETDSETMPDYEHITH